MVYPERCEPDQLRVAGPGRSYLLGEAEQLEYRDAALGEQFGPLWATYWFGSRRRCRPSGRAREST